MGTRLPGRRDDKEHPSSRVKSLISSNPFTVTWLNSSAVVNDILILCDGFNVTAKDFHCPKMQEFCSCPELEPDPDIAGIGVMTAFILSSFLTLICTLLYLCLIRSGLSEADSFNPIDYWLRDNIAERVTSWVRKCPWVDQRHERVQKALFELVQSLADTQLATGTAILSAGIIRLHRGNISVYHFSMVRNLAWLSSNVQLLSLLALRTESIGSLKRHRRQQYHQPDPGAWPRIRASIERWADIKLRVAWMLAMAGMLLYGSWVSGWEEWDSNYCCPANCAFGRKRGGEPLVWLVVDFVLVIWGYSTHVFLLLSPRAQIWWLDKIRDSVVDNEALPLVQTRDWQRWTRWVWYFFSSETLEIVLSGFVWFILGIVWIWLDLKSMSKDAETVRAKENDVEGFGQLVPLFLVVLPFSQILQSYCAQSRDEDKRATGAPLHLTTANGREAGLGMTPLHESAAIGREAVVRLRLERGDDKDAKANDHRTPLHLAASGGHGAVVKLLLEWDADKNATANDDRTPLHDAAEAGREAVVKLLLERGADKNAKAKNDHRTPLHLAASGGHGAIVWLLLEWDADKNAKAKNDDRTPLHLAASGGHRAVVKLLLEWGADKNAKANDGRTPLDDAAEAGREAVVKLLLERGADENAKAKNDHRTPLHLAASGGHGAVVKLLLEWRADKDATANDDRTPLHDAAEAGRETVVKLLLERGADKNVKAKNDHRTPLHLAASGGHGAIVWLLLEWGADKNAKANDGRTPLDDAAEAGREAIFKLLRE